MAGFGLAFGAVFGADFAEAGVWLTAFVELDGFTGLVEALTF